MADITQNNQNQPANLDLTLKQEDQQQPPQMYPPLQQLPVQNDFLNATLTSLNDIQLFKQTLQKIQEEQQKQYQVEQESLPFLNPISFQPQAQASCLTKNGKSDDSFRYDEKITFEYHSFKTVEHLIANSMQGYLIYILRTYGPLFDEQIMPHLKEAYKDLRKPNGLEYKTEARRAMRGILFANKQVFTTDVFGHFLLAEKIDVDRYLQNLKIKYEKLRNEIVQRKGQEIPPYNEANCYINPLIKQRADTIFGSGDIECVNENGFQNEDKSIVKGSDDSSGDEDDEYDQSLPSQYRNNNSRKHQPYKYDRALNLYNFLENTVSSVSQQQLNKTLQDPFYLVKDLKEKDLLEIFNKNERFKGMLELYGIFREIIAHERMSDIHDRSGRIQKMFNSIEEMLKQVTYADEAQRFLSNHVMRDNSFVKIPFIDNSQNQQLQFGVPQPQKQQGVQVLSSGIKIFASGMKPAPEQSPAQQQQQQQLSQSQSQKSQIQNGINNKSNVNLAQNRQQNDFKVSHRINAAIGGLI